MILSALDYDTLDDMVLYFKNNLKPFYFEAPVAPGVVVVANWEDEDLVDEPSQLIQVHVDPEEVGPDYNKVAYDTRELDFRGKFFEELDDELGMMMDGHFRSSIHQRTTGPLVFEPEMSDDDHHVFTADVPIRRDRVAAV